MTTKLPSILRSALSLLTLRRIADQIGLALLVFLLAVLWLRIPDASVFEVIGSALFGLLLLAIAGVGQARIFLQLCNRPTPWRKLLRGALPVLVSIALWLGWRALLAHWNWDDYEIAGYLVSRMPYWLRRFVPYEHLAMWLGWARSIFDWWGAGILAIFAFAFIASSRPMRAILLTLSSLTYWLALAIGSVSAPMLTHALIAWTPGHGPGIEVLSLLLRLSAAVIFDCAVVTLLLAILAACITHSDARYETPADTPDDSHPRTAERP